MKQREIKPCIGCGQGVMHDNNLAFYRLRASYMIANTQAIGRQHGLEMVIGNPLIASVMGTDEDLATAMQNADELVCLNCAMCEPLAVLMEKAARKEDDEPAATG